jgi:ankyrin repeat protein
MIASDYGRKNIVKVLVEKGVKASSMFEKTFKLDIQDKFGWTALMRASWNGHLEIVKILIENSAKLDIQDKYGRTALYYQLNNIQGIKIFLQSKQYSNKIKGLKRKNISFNEFITL